MKKTMGYWLLAIGLTAVAPAMARAQDMGLEIGSMAPGAKLHTLDGKDADLAQYVGKTPVLIEFWATWCANCKELEPALKAAAAISVSTKAGRPVCLASRSRRRTLFQPTMVVGPTKLIDSTPNGPGSARPTPNSGRAGRSAANSATSAS